MASLDQALLPTAIRAFSNILVILLLGCAAHAITPNSRISQYGHSSWHVQDGAFRGSPTAIAQTRDGYIYIGTRHGLLRFDGVTFTPWEHIGGSPLLTDVSTLFGASDGSLWIGLRSRLLRWKDGVVTDYPDVTGYINDIRQDNDGSIWVARSRNFSQLPLCKVTTDRVRCYGKKQGIPYRQADHSLAVSSGVLVAASGSIGIWNQNSFSEISTFIPESMKGLASTGGLTIGPDGALLLGLTRGGKHLGLQRFSNGTWVPLRFGTFDSSSLSVSALLTTSGGTLWIGTTNQGLYRIRGSVVDHYGLPDGLSANSIEDIFLDREGDLWVATSAGVDMFRDLSVLSYSTLQGMSSDRAAAVATSPRGTVAVNNGNAIDLLSSDHSASVRTLKGLPPGQISGLLFDHSGRLWAGIGHSLYVIDEQSTRRKLVARTRNGIVEEVVEDQSHTISVLMIENGVTHLLRLEKDQITNDVDTGQAEIVKIAPGNADDLYVSDVNGQVARFQWDRTMTPLGGTSDRKTISDLQVDTDGTITATTGRGMLVIKGDRRLLLSTANGLPCNITYKLLRTSTDDLWLYSDCGLVLVARAEYEHFLEDPAYKVHARLLDEFQGALPSRSTFSPGGARSINDLLYFVNDQFLQVFDPSEEGLNRLPPPVYVERVLGDQFPVVMKKEGAVLPAHTLVVQIDYAGLSYVVPQRVRFRYKLEGLDKNWQEAGTRRQAFYTNVPPGNYTFRVSACNNNGLWNTDGAAFPITIRPAYYQSAWFRVLCSLLLVGLSYIVFVLRVRSLSARIHEKWAERVSERERIARELHDTFFQGIQGILLRVGTAARSLPGSTPARFSLEEALDQSQEVMLTGRQLVQDLRKAGTAFTLLDGLETVGREFQSLYPVAYQTDCQGRQRPLNLQVADELCKVGREAISNAFRHSDASLISVVLDYDARAFGLTVRDNGRGIDETILIDGRKTGHWGLPGMRERVARVGGSIRFESKQGDGTTVEIRVPAKRVYRGKRFRFRSWLRGIREGNSE